MHATCVRVHRRAYENPSPIACRRVCARYDAARVSRALACGAVMHDERAAEDALRARKREACAGEGPHFVGALERAELAAEVAYHARARRGRVALP